MSFRSIDCVFPLGNKTSSHPRQLKYFLGDVIVIHTYRLKAENRKEIYKRMAMQCNEMDLRLRVREM